MFFFIFLVLLILRAVTLFLLKIFLNFKNCKEAMPKLILKPLITFCFNEVFMPKTLCKCEYRTQFMPWFCGATENIFGGGGGCEESAFKRLHDHIRSGTKGASAIGPHSFGRGSLYRWQRSEKPNSSRLFSLHAAWCTVPKLKRVKANVLYLPRQVRHFSNFSQKMEYSRNK